ncbi:hypothetical protein Syun_013686 [Stephania yunnanensis]|uniref:Rieske domain-containing protein n=1 Tax=Stephania yunnanensis TaxID=152371 RepID=A0AAP0JIZ7_9MAGN
MAATTTTTTTLAIVPNSAKSQSRLFRSPPRNLSFSLSLSNARRRWRRRRSGRGGLVVCEAADVTLAEASSPPPPPPPSGGVGRNWVPVVPLTALPKGERRVILQDGETILLLWYKDEVFAIENRSPAEGAYSEGLLNAKLTQDGCIVCPTTDSTFDLKTGDIKDWYPKNPVLRVLTPPLRKLFTYPVKIEDENIYISLGGASVSSVIEIVFSACLCPGSTAQAISIEKVKEKVVENEEGGGFSSRHQIRYGHCSVILDTLYFDFMVLRREGLVIGTSFDAGIYSLIDLGNAALSGQLVAQLGQLRNLQYLELYSNNISGTIPSDLGNLTSLGLSLEVSCNEQKGHLSTIPCLDPSLHADLTACIAFRRVLQSIG